MVSWHEYMKTRIEGREKGIPWFLHDKLSCFDWSERLGFPIPYIYDVFDDPSLIRVNGNLSSFVLKPTKFSSTRGVMLLERSKSKLYDSMSKKMFSAEGVIEFQRGLSKRFPVSGNKWIIEERISDGDGRDIPLDFKAYSFRGHVELFLVIDRSTSPMSVAWFDCDLLPINSRDISLNPKYVQKLEGLVLDSYPELVQLASKVSAAVNTPFSRIDLYNSARGPLLGEVTLTPGGLYYGDHYRMSSAMDQLMGSRWLLSELELAESRDVLARLAYGSVFSKCSGSEQNNVNRVMNFPYLLGRALDPSVR